MGLPGQRNALAGIGLSGSGGYGRRVQGFRLHRELPRGVHRLVEVVEGLEHARGMKVLFPKDAERRKFLESVDVFLSPFQGYMWIDDAKGRVVCSHDYLQHGEEQSVFLDLVHELVHIVQHREGRELWDESFSYVDRPTEVEAYRVAVEEARELGWGEEQICEYLHVPWCTDEEHARLCKTMGVRYFPKKRS
jgi:hypothetical protein